MFENEHLEEQVQDAPAVDEVEDDNGFDLDEPGSDARWYVVHTYTGHEIKVKQSIEKIVQSKEMGDQILRVNVPVSKVEKEKTSKKKAEEGKKEYREKIIYPGYVFIKMIHNDKSWFLVRNTRGVTGFVGAGTKPTPLTKEEVDTLRNASKKIISRFEVGDKVQITKEGFLQGSYGVVEEVYPERETVKVLISSLNNAPTEVSYSKVIKIN